MSVTCEGVRVGLHVHIGQPFMRAKKERLCGPKLYAMKWYEKSKPRGSDARVGCRVGEHMQTQRERANPNDTPSPTYRAPVCTNHVASHY